MNDDRLDALLGSFYRDTALTPRDREQGMAEVMDRVRQTRQRGRWWALPLFRRQAPKPTATDTADYRPSPIPATNGRAPTVIGRTQTMFSPIKAIVAGALVFALGGLFLIAQPLDRQGGGVPGAAQPSPSIAPAGATLISGTTPECSPESMGTFPESAGVSWHLDWVLECLVTANDPRVSGTATVQFNSLTPQPGDAEVFWGDQEIVGPDGSWVGGFIGVDGDQVAVLAGTGAYEGWTYVYRADPITGEYTGIVYQGSPPPAPAWPLGAAPSPSE